MNSITTNKRNIKNYEFIFFFLSIINVVITLYFKIEYGVLLLFAYILVLRVAKVIDDQTFLLLSLFVPNKYLQLLAIPLYLFFKRALITKKEDKKTLIFVLLVFCVSTINCIFYGGMIVGTLFQTVVYYCILKFIPTFDREIEIQSIIDIFNMMFVLQVITAGIEYLYYRMITDTITGTMISAHYLGVFLLVYLYISIKKSNWQNKRFKIIKIVSCVFLLFISDAKHVWIMFVVAFLISVLLRKLKVKNPITVVGVILTVGVVSFVYLGNNGGLTFLTNHFGAATTYLYDTNYNKKMLFFSNTLEKMYGINGLVGFGVGQYGSQVSVSMAKGIIYSWDSSLQNYSYAIRPYADAISGVMTEWYVKTGITNSSMVLGYPLVSFIAIFAELGVIGFLFLLRLFDRFFKNDNPIFMIFFLFITLFDTYFEIPCVFVVLLIATQIANEKRREKV